MSELPDRPEFAGFDKPLGVALLGDPPQIFDKPLGVVLLGVPYALVPQIDGRPGFRAYRLTHYQPEVPS